MYKRINVTLPEDTVRIIDRVAKKGERSRFIAEAIKHYAQAMTRASLRKKLKEEATQWAAHDLKLTEDFLHVDEETWSSHEK